MEFWLGLSEHEKAKRVARQRLLRRLFWVLGAAALVFQIVFLTLPAQPESPPTRAPTQIAGPVSLAQDAAPSPTVSATTAPAPTVPVPTATPVPTPSPMAPAPTIPSPTRANLLTGRSYTPQASAALALLTPPHQVIEQQFRLAGTGHPGDTVSIRYRRSQIAEGEVDQDGNWRLDIPTAPLARGKNTLYALAGADDRPVPFTISFDPWWLDAPTRLQGDLGEGYACAPTVLGMAMDYYHQLDPEHQAPASTEIVQALKDQGFVDGYGADAQMLVHLAIEYGYSHSFFFRAWSQAHLRSMLDERTPVIANVRVDMSTDGYGHSVLVIGLSPDGTRVMVNDPTLGLVEYAWDEFNRSWGSFGPPYHHGLVIKP
jgi:hypothetical protein